MADEPTKLQERAREHCEHYMRKHIDALEVAQQAAQTTGTPAWQDRYEQNVKDHRQIENTQIGVIRQEVKTIKIGGSDEESEKQIRDAVKALKEERERYEAWHSRAVAGYQSAAESPAQIARTCTQAAGRAEQESPLVNAGLREEVEAIVESWPAVSWDSDGGRVVIDQGGSYGLEVAV